MSSVNKVIIVGNLGKDPDIRYAPNGDAVANFSVATSEKYKSKQTGEMVETTEWHNIVAWRRLAEICGEYLKKGSKVYIEGRIQTRKWKDKQENDRYTTEINCQEMKMLDSRQSGDQGGQQQQRPPQQQQQRSQPQQQQVPEGGFDDFDDEIPY